jgi:beta-glucanase (GH16 family)
MVLITKRIFMKILYTLLVSILLYNNCLAQTIQDNFEGNGNITTWFGDNCAINTNLNNPHQNGINLSSKVLKYDDTGSQYANIRFDAGRNLNIPNYSTFSIKIYVPSSSITGTSPNQISLKLQDGNLPSPWSSQCEIIKPILLNQWQTVTFDFALDPYLNFDASSPAPTRRTDFNRAVLQVNGENNNDHVIAYLDDFYYFDSTFISPPIQRPIYNRLVWSDEFNTNGAIDNTKWFHQTQLPSGGSWYNGEIQHYTNRTTNSVVNNGVLSVIAKKETFTNQGHTKQYTSARLNSKFAFTYGKVEVRAKLPTGVGTWPAIWTLGKNITESGAYWQTQGFGTASWPACGEIDIMEHWGNNQNFVQSATHTPSSSGNTVNHGGQTITTASTRFHVYTLEWFPDELVFSVDSVVHFIYHPNVKNSSTWPFNAAQYMLFNVAVQPSITSGFQQDSMNIDYIRIYQSSLTSLEEVQFAENPLVYPNPFTDRLTVDLKKDLNTTVQVHFLDISGKLIRSISATPSKGLLELTNLKSLPKGVYFLNILGKDFSKTIKLVK